jgi:hypothetical protein
MLGQVGQVGQLGHGGTHGQAWPIQLHRRQPAAPWGTATASRSRYQSAVAGWTSTGGRASVDRSMRPTTIIATALATAAAKSSQSTGS